MLHLRFVETLRVVAERGSFSAAAQALQYTQPAISRQVALLERAAGMPLVVRSRRGVYLTEAGRLVVEHGDAIGARTAAPGGPWWWPLVRYVAASRAGPGQGLVTRRRSRVARQFVPP